MHLHSGWSIHSTQRGGAHIDILKSGIKQTYVFEAVVRVEKKCLHYHIIKAKVICLRILTVCKVRRYIHTYIKVIRNF